MYNSITLIICILCSLHQCETVQGDVAFHPAAAEDPSDCAAWVTVCASKVALLVAVLFFFMNLATWNR